MQIETISRLIEIKKNDVENLSIDLVQLHNIKDSAEKNLENVQQDHADFLQQLVQAESGQSILVAVDMVSQRHYLTHLNQKIIHAENTMFQISEQIELAQHNLKKAYIEMKSFEIILKRKRSFIRLEVNRKELAIADDQELLRINGRNIYVEH